MDQLNLFELMYEKYKITKPIRLIELFGGIGSQAKALENLHANFEHYKLVEFDKYPVASYNEVHHTHFEPTDITKIHASDLEIKDRDKYEYIMTYSFPCQDLSLSGKRKGMKKGEGTRSGLLWEVERLLTECTELPQILLMENVPQVIGEKNLDDFKAWQLFLENKGYTNYIQVLNAKDYGIPQNRQRCFMVSIQGEAYYEFPKPIPLKLKLKDMLEEKVDEKYFISKKMIDYISAKGSANFKNPDCKINLEIARPLTTDQNKRAGTTNYISNNLPDNYDLNNRGEKNKNLIETLEKVDVENIKDCAYLDAYNKKVITDGTAKTLLIGVDFRNQDFLVIKNATKQGYLKATEGDGIDISSRMENHRGTVQKGMIQTLDTQCNQGVVVDTQKELRIRKLTPKECWRLMGFDDIDFDRASKVNSNAQLYKQAGNSIVVNVLVAIFGQLL